MSNYNNAEIVPLKPSAIMADVRAALPDLKKFTNAECMLIVTDLLEKEPTATAQDAVRFLYMAETRGLNPLTRQLYALRMYSEGKPVLSFVTGIDGMRAIAHRSGCHGGYEDISLILDNGQPIGAKCVVLRYENGRTTRYPAEAYVTEYAKKKKDGFTYTKFWKDMPGVMIRKVAEAAALRMAFPELDGLYCAEEMDQGRDDRQDTDLVQRDPIARELPPEREITQPVEMVFESLAPHMKPSEAPAMPDEADLAEMKAAVPPKPALSPAKGWTEKQLECLAAVKSNGHLSMWVDYRWDQRYSGEGDWRNVTPMSGKSLQTYLRVLLRIACKADKMMSAGDKAGAYTEALNSHTKYLETNAAEDLELEKFWQGVHEAISTATETPTGPGDQDEMKLPGGTIGASVQHDRTGE